MFNPSIETKIAALVKERVKEISDRVTERATAEATERLNAVIDGEVARALSHETSEAK